MEREIIRVEPFATNFEKWGVPVSVCTPGGEHGVPLGPAAVRPGDRGTRS